MPRHRWLLKKVCVSVDTMHLCLHTHRHLLTTSSFTAEWCF